jgi:HAE1 family hydrophobic/amphiphilic exporter-1
MLINILLALALIYFVMASLFESLLFPAAIWTQILFAVVGVFWFFLATGTTMTMMGMIGILILIGVVVNNGIILIEYTNQLRGEGKPLVTAAILAARTRLRPVLISSFTNIFGLLPMALGLGGGNNMQPLAVVTLGGLCSSTFFTIFVVPAAYVLMTRIQCFVSGTDEVLDAEIVMKGDKAV